MPAGGSETHRDLAIKMAEKATANQSLMDILEMYSIFLLELTENPSNASQFAVRVKCGTTPTDIMGQMAALLGRSDAKPDDEIMFNITGIERVPMEDQPESVKKSFQKGLESARQAGTPSSIVVLLYFTSETGGSAVVVTSRTIVPKMVEYIKSEPKVDIASAMFGNQKVKLTPELLQR